VCLCEYVSARLVVCMCVCVRACVRACVHACVHACVRACVHVYVYMYVYVYVPVCVCVCVYHVCGGTHYLWYVCSEMSPVVVLVYLHDMSHVIYESHLTI